MRISRVLSAFLCVAALAYGLSACGSTSPYAVRVNGETTSQSTVTKQLKALAGSKEFAKLVEQGGQTKITNSKGTLNAVITADWLNFVIQDQVVSQELAKRHIKVTAADRKAAKPAAESFYGSTAGQTSAGQPASKGAFSSFPKSFQDSEIERLARRAAYARTPTKKVTDAEVRTSYNTQLASALQQCPTKKFVEHILVKTKAEADAVEQQLKAGTNFNKIASQKSIDSGSKALGGQVGCLETSRAQLDPAFVAAADKLALNVPSDPVQTQFGYHVIMVTDTVSFEAVKGAVRKNLEQSSGTAFSTLLKKAKVKVNPRYGTWVRSGQTGPHVEPPKGSTPTTKAPAVSGTAPAGTTPATQPPTSTP